MKNIYELAGEKIIITAEIGINHNGDLQLAEDMIDAAADCGVDAVKFQAFNTQHMYSRLTPGFTHTDTDVFSQIQKLEIRPEWWPRLKERAQKHGLFFSASIFDLPSLTILKEIGIDFVKVASSEIDNLDFLEKQIGLSPVFVISTGMALVEEIATVLSFLRSKEITQIILLECTSSYPAPPESIYLLNIDFMIQTFGVPAGFSDHTIGSHHAAAAAARGARFIEKHFTLDKNMPGPDQKISADIPEMKSLITAVRDIEIALKTNRKAFVSNFEENSRRLGRKSVIASKPIRKGDIFTQENTVVKRPGLGIKPGEAPFLFGRSANTDIDSDHWITWDMVEQPPKLPKP